MIRPLQSALGAAQRAIRRSERAKALLRRAMIAAGVDAIDTADGARIVRIPAAERHLFRPFYSPWLAGGEFETLFRAAQPHTMLSRDRLWVLYTLLQQTAGLGGEVWEAGTYRGGTALFLRDALGRPSGTPPPALRVFDTFSGMPGADPRHDEFRAGAYRDTSEAAVRALLADAPFIHVHPGVVPESFAGLETARIGLAHLDVDLYEGIRGCCAFLYPRTVPGGVLVFDDYGFPNAPGCRRAVDEFFAELPEVPLVLATGQALVFKRPPTV